MTSKTISARYFWVGENRSNWANTYQSSTLYKIESRITLCRFVLRSSLGLQDPKVLLDFEDNKSLSSRRT